MKRYELQDSSGNILLIAEAADSTDAHLYGYRTFPGRFARAVEVGVYGSQAHVVNRLRESLGRLGVQVDEPTPARAVQIPHQAPSSSATSLQENRFTGRPFRGTHSRLVDLKEPAQHTPRPREKGTVELNETTVQAQLNAALARLGIHTSGEEEDL